MTRVLFSKLLLLILMLAMFALVIVQSIIFMVLIEPESISWLTTCSTVIDPSANLLYTLPLFVGSAFVEIYIPLLSRITSDGLVLSPNNLKRICLKTGSHVWNDDELMLSASVLSHERDHRTTIAINPTTYFLFCIVCNA